MKRAMMLSIAVLFLTVALWVSAPLTGSAQAAPAAPTGFQATASSISQINLSWNAVSGATSYQLYRSMGTSSSYTRIAILTARAYIDTDLKAATRYNYKVRAVKSGNLGAFTAVKTAYTKPTIPTGLTARTISTSQIDLNWNAVTGATSYQVYRSYGASTNYIRVAIVTTSKYSNKGLAVGTRYNYKVCAVTSSSVGGFSAVKTAYTKPAIPVGLVAKTISTSQIDLSWSAVTGATSYQVYRSYGASANYIRVAIVTGPKYSNKGLAVGTRYNYKVRAVKSGNYGDFTAAKTAYTKPATPTGLTATAVSTSQIDLNWNVVTGVTSYQVYRSTGSSTSYERISIVTAPNYSDKSCAAGTSYSYKVRAVKSGNMGGFTASCAATTASATEYLADGIYTFLIKDGGKAMNLDASSDAAADKDGTRVTVWTDTGHSTQRFRVQNIGNNKCRIYAMSSSNGTNRVLNLNRNSSVPIAAGIRITLWQVSVAEDQEWIITKTADGYYKIALACKPSLVIGCDSPYTNGSDLKLQDDNGSGVQLFVARKYDPPATILPLSGSNVVVSSEYGMRNGSMHGGIDMYGSSAILAVADGIVLDAKYSSDPKGYRPNDAGNYVAIQHNDGHVTLYFHCSNILVSTGQ